MQNFELISCANADELASRAAGAWLDEIELANRAGKPHCVALSGGRIAQKFFAAVVEQARLQKIGDGGTPSFPTNVHFFWADERCVPPTDPESNFKLASELLFAPLKISETQIHRIRGELLPEAAAKVANEEIRRVLPISSPPPQRGEGRGEEAVFSKSKPLTPPLSPLGRGEGVYSLPSLDLIFLGLGEDGHVASLFPNVPSQILNCAVPFLAVEDSPKPPPRRVTMSYAAIAAANQVWVLVSGAGKAAALRDSLKPDAAMPLARVVRLRSRTTIFSDVRAG
jgi:6-phosphogluconolactonase